MSQNTWRQIELERQRREQLRLDQVRRQALALVATCENEIAAVNDPAVQQLSAQGLKSVRQELQQAAVQVNQAPDQALKAVRAAQKHLHRVITEARAAAHRWSLEQAASKAMIDEARAQAAAQEKASNEAGAKVLAQVNEKLVEAGSLHDQRQYLQAAAKCKEVESLIEKAERATLDETVRREVIRGLLATLREMGFVVEDPSLEQQEGGGSMVVLNGQLPSGRTARFEVSIDGRMRYDLDGYEGRTCAEQVERIEQTLRDHFGVQMGPAQVTWKNNPDRISKGARNLPTDVTHQTTH